MFLVCGEALWDLFAVDREDGLNFEARMGGSPFNIAVGLARLDQASALFTGLSTDPLGRRLAAALDREGVDVRHIVRADRPSTLSVVDVGPNGAPAYAFYGADAADRAVRLDDLPELGPDVWGVHAGSYSLVVEPVGAALLALFEREAGRRLLTLDPNIRLTVEPDAALWRNRVERFVAHADIVKVSDEDLGLIYPGVAAREIAERWLAAGAALVIVTQGVDGAEAHVAAGRHAVPSNPVDVIDAVGAGDAFQAALIAGLAERGIRDRMALDDMDADAVRGLIAFAARAAAITCSRRGADLPRRNEI